MVPPREKLLHPVSLPIGQFYSHKEIASHKATVADVVQQLCPLPRSDVLRWLCSLSKGILMEGGMAPATQLQWARQLFPAEWCEKLESMMQMDGSNAGVVFHRRAVWFTLQLAVMSCGSTPDGATAAISNEEIAKRTGQACFMASDVLNDIESEYHDSLPQGEATEWMIAALVPMLDSACSRVDFDLLGRARLLWQDVRKSAEFQKELTTHKVSDFEETAVSNLNRNREVGFSRRILPRGLESRGMLGAGG